MNNLLQSINYSHIAKGPLFCDCTIKILLGWWSISFSIFFRGGGSHTRTSEHRWTNKGIELFNWSKWMNRQLIFIPIWQRQLRCHGGIKSTLSTDESDCPSFIDHHQQPIRILRFVFVLPPVSFLNRISIQLSINRSELFDRNRFIVEEHHRAEENHKYGQTATDRRRQQQKGSQSGTYTFYKPVDKK